MGEPKPPDLRTGLDVAPDHGLLVGVLDLGQERKWIVRSQQVQGEAGMKGAQGAKDGGMPDRVRDRSGVKSGNIGIMFVATATSGCSFLMGSDLV